MLIPTNHPRYRVVRLCVGDSCVETRVVFTEGLPFPPYFFIGITALPPLVIVEMEAVCHLFSLAGVLLSLDRGMEVLFF